MKSTRTLISIFLILLGAYFVITASSPVNYFNATIGITIAIGGFIFLGRGRDRSRSAQKYKVAFDFISIVLIGIFFLTILFGGLGGLIGNDQASINVSTFLIEMEIGGIVMTLISGVFAIKGNITENIFKKELLYISMSFAGFLFLNLIVPPKAPTLIQSIASSSKFITVTISIPEETVFRAWLAPWLANVSHTGPIGGSIGAAVIGMAYHFFVYGTDPSKLFIVFAAFFIEGMAAIRSKILSTTITMHLLNNAVSVGLFR